MKTCYIIIILTFAIVYAQCEVDVAILKAKMNTEVIEIISEFKNNKPIKISEEYLFGGIDYDKTLNLVRKKLNANIIGEMELIQLKEIDLNELTIHRVVINHNEKLYLMVLTFFLLEKKEDYILYNLTISDKHKEIIGAIGEPMKVHVEKSKIFATQSLSKHSIEKILSSESETIFGSDIVESNESKDEYGMLICLRHSEVVSNINSEILLVYNDRRYMVVEIIYNKDSSGNQILSLIKYNLALNICNRFTKPL